jgi:hypothetical protein
MYLSFTISNKRTGIMGEQGILQYIFNTFQEVYNRTYYNSTLVLLGREGKWGRTIAKEY